MKKSRKLVCCLINKTYIKIYFTTQNRIHNYQNYLHYWVCSCLLIKGKYVYFCLSELFVIIYFIFIKIIYTRGKLGGHIWHIGENEFKVILMIFVELKFTFDPNLSYITMSFCKWCVFDSIYVFVIYWMNYESFLMHHL